MAKNTILKNFTGENGFSEGSFFFILFFLFLLGMNLSQTLKDFSEGLLVLYGFFLSFRFKRKFYYYEDSFKILAAWLLGAFLSYFSSRHLGADVNGLLDFKWVVTFLVLTFLLSRYDLLKGKENVFAVIFLFSFLLSVFLFLKGGGRAGGISGNPINFANIVAPFTLLLFSFAIQSVVRKSFFISSFIFGLSSFLGIILVVLSQTRGVILFFLPLLLVVSFFYGKKIFLSIFLSVSFVMGILFFSFPSLNQRLSLSLSSKNLSDKDVRFAIWEGHFNLWKEYPFLGVGYNSNDRLYQNYLDEKKIEVLAVNPDLRKTHAHNQFLQIMAGGGLLGITCYIFFLGTLYFYLFRSYQLLPRDSRHYAWVVGLFAALTCFLLSGITEANFTVTKNRYVFVLIAAFIFALYRLVGREANQKGIS